MRTDQGTVFLQGTNGKCPQLYKSLGDSMCSSREKMKEILIYVFLYLQISPSALATGNQYIPPRSVLHRCNLWFPCVRARLLCIWSGQRLRRHGAPEPKTHNAPRFWEMTYFNTREGAGVHIQLFCRETHWNTLFQFAIIYHNSSLFQFSIATPQ